mgnify:CR=1 FL=1
MGIKENLEKAALLFGDSHEPKCVVMTEESKQKVIGDDFDMVDYGLSDNDIDEIEVIDGNLRLHLMANVPYIEHTKDDAIAIAKALGVTADDLI